MASLPPASSLPAPAPDPVPHDRAAPASGGVRADLQGLRALAVALVVADHVWGGPVGGFIGVDVFFVLSGFLITGLLVREHHRHGGVGYADFYRRRVRRIVPVATLVIVVTIAATYALYSDARGDQVADDGLWAFFFGANWHFSAIGTDYFLAGGPVSPLQHYWSLSVEEQFYIVWPTVLALGLGGIGVARRRWRPRALLPVLVAVFLLGSLGWSLHHSASDPVAAYFSTFDRAWELLVGATLALLAPRLVGLSRALRVGLGWGGLVAVVVAALVITESSRFPAPAALLPVLGTAAVIAAGVGGPQPWLVPLVNPVARYVGDISYSIYLWHFPVVVLLPAYLPDGGTGFKLVATGLTLVLSVFSFHMLEDPVRRSQWLEPRWRRAQHPTPVGQGSRLANAWLALAAVVALVAAATALRPDGPAEQVQLLAPDAPGSAAPGAGKGGGGKVPVETAAEHLTKRIEQTLSLQDYPRLDPPIDDLGIDKWYEQVKAAGCLSVPPDQVDACRFGKSDADVTAVVIGDSYAIAWMPAVREALGDHFSIQQLTLQECPAWDAQTNHYSGAPYPECPQYRAWTWEQLARIHPDLVIMASSYADAAVLSSGATGSAALAEVRAGMERSLAKVVPTAELTVVLAPPPGAPDLETCVTAVGSPDDCERSIVPAWFDLAGAEQQTASAAGAAWVDTRSWFCLDDLCPGFVGATPVYADGSHLTVEYSEQLGPVLYDALTAIVADLKRTNPK